VTRCLVDSNVLVRGVTHVLSLDSGDFTRYAGLTPLHPDML
jgi:hypothetical protein